MKNSKIDTAATKHSKPRRHILLCPNCHKGLVAEGKQCGWCGYWLKGVEAE